MPQTHLKEKTLIAWVSLDNLSQRGGSAITIDGGDGVFDGIVYGEIQSSRWMAGSNYFSRTQRTQTNYPIENANPSEYVQIAIVYKTNKITIFRNGDIYASYSIGTAHNFDVSDCVILFGRRHLDAGNPQNSFTGKIKDARIYDIPLSQATIQALSAGSVEGGPEPWAWWDFSNNGLQDVTRKFTNFELIGGAFLEEGNLVLKGNGASLIARRKESEWDKTKPVTKTVIRNTRSFREKLLSDPYRPAYHFCVPEDNGYPGDPNGAFYHDGRYHLMYLYNREGSGFSWGHISSADLLHWRHHPDAIGPGNGDEGCFSGGGFVDKDGSAILSYWMLWGAKGIGLARSTDENFDTWEKLTANPVIQSTEWGITQMKDEDGKDIYIGSADPSNIWVNNGKYYMLAGNLPVLNKIGREPDSPEDEKGDRVYLFESEDLENWKYLHRFYESKREWTKASEDNMCPSFLPLPSSPNGGPASDKHLLLFISHNLGCQYYIGDYGDNKFLPESHGRMTWTDSTYFAPEALIDGQGRQIMWSWIFDDRPNNLKTESGWTGTYGLPRSLWLNEDGKLGIRPIKELQNLRLDEKSIASKTVRGGSEIVLDSLGEELMEIELIMDPRRSEKVKVEVCVSEDGREKTLIEYDPVQKELSVDTRLSSLRYGRKAIERAPLELKNGELLELRIFIDRSIVEVFANDRQAIARRIYPTLNGKGFRVSARRGKSEIKSLKRWKLMPSNPY